MIKSFSKINLFLNVLKKTKNGLHNIQSSVMLLNLHDKINIKNSNKDEIKFVGRFAKNINKNTNSISKTLSALRKHNLINKKIKYKITINKNIPVFGGLGGGTSNAAFLVKYFLKNNINNKLLTIFEKIVGSDFRLFFFTQSYQQSLKNIFKFKKNYLLYFVLIYPNINCSTKEIYSKIEKINAPLKSSILKISSKNKFIELIKSQNNDLQTIVEKKHKKIKKILNFIQLQKNCLFSRMTGSGSVCFGAFLNKKSSSQGLKVIKKKFPSYWCILTKSI
tara:strand:- start:1763 stop:2596 length:834 start_codon:yes stop_codon:yes gene_type:complete